MSKAQKILILIGFLTLLVAISSLAVAVHEWNPENGGV